MSNFDFTRSREIDPGFVAPSADFGSAHAFEQAFKMGQSENFTVMGQRAIKYWSLRKWAELTAASDGVGSADPDFIDQETFNRDYSVGGSLKFDAHLDGKMSRFYAQALMEDHIEDRVNEAKATQSNSPIASLAGSLAGSLLSPADLAINLAIPELAVAKFGMAASVASRSGTGAARIVSRTLNSTVTGAAEGIIMQVPMVAIADHNQVDYSFQDALANVAVSPLIGAAAGLLHGSVRHVFGEADRQLANAAMHMAATDKDPALLAKIAASDPKMKKALEMREKIKDALGKSESERTRIRRRRCSHGRTGSWSRRQYHARRHHGGPVSNLSEKQGNSEAKGPC